MHEVLCSRVSFKTPVLLCCSHISNKYTFDRMIIKLLTSLFQYHDICITIPHVQVLNFPLLTASTASKYVACHFAIGGCHCYCFRHRTVGNVNCSFHCRDLELLWTVYLLYHDVCLINDDPIRHLSYAILLRRKWCHEIRFNVRYLNLIHEIIVRRFTAISLDYH